MHSWTPVVVTAYKSGWGEVEGWCREGIGHDTLSSELRSRAGCRLTWYRCFRRFQIGRNKVILFNKL